MLFFVYHVSSWFKPFLTDVFVQILIQDTQLIRYLSKLDWSKVSTIFSYYEKGKSKILTKKCYVHEDLSVRFLICTPDNIQSHDVLIRAILL